MIPIKSNNFVVLGLCFILLLIGLQVNLPFGIDEGLTATPWLAMGIIYFRHATRWSNHLFLQGALFVILLLIIPRESLDMDSKTYGDLSLNFIWALIMILFLTCAVKLIPLQGRLNGMVELWGTQTMIIFILHPYTNNIGHILDQKIGWNSWLLRFFISIVCLQGLIMLKRRYAHNGLLKYV